MNSYYAKRIRQLRNWLIVYQLSFFLLAAAAILLYTRWDIEREAFERYAKDSQRRNLEWINNGDFIGIDPDGRAIYKFPPIGKLPKADDYRDSVVLKGLPARTIRRGRQAIRQSLH